MITGDKFTQLDIKGSLFAHHPLVKTAAAQGLALVLVLEFGLLERDDVGHGYVVYRS